jgi:hypothetical protein
MNNAVAWVAIAISLVSASISLASYWTNREKLRLDLYDRRLRIYKRALDLYTEVMRWAPSPGELELGTVSPSSELNDLQKAFVKASFEAQFLFSEESGVSKLLQQLGDDAFRIVNWKVSYGPQLARWNQEGYITEYAIHAKRLARFMESMEPIRKQMAPFLNFHNYSAAPTLFLEQTGDQWP